MQLSKEDNEKLKQLEEQIDYHQVLMYENNLQPIQCFGLTFISLEPGTGS